MLQPISALNTSVSGKWMFTTDLTGWINRGISLWCAESFLHFYWNRHVWQPSCREYFIALACMHSQGTTSILNCKALSVVILYIFSLLIYFLLYLRISLVIAFFFLVFPFFHFSYSLYISSTSFLMTLGYPFRHSITLCTLLQLYLFCHVVSTLFKVQIYVHFSSLFLWIHVPKS